MPAVARSRENAPLQHGPGHLWNRVDGLLYHETPRLVKRRALTVASKGHIINN